MPASGGVCLIEDFLKISNGYDKVIMNEIIPQVKLFFDKDDDGEVYVEGILYKGIAEEETWEFRILLQG
jgi:hypothetical protein